MFLLHIFNFLNFQDWGIENSADGMKIKIFIKSSEKQFLSVQPEYKKETQVCSKLKRKRTTSDKLAANEAVEKQLVKSEEDCFANTETKRKTRYSVANDQFLKDASVKTSSTVIFEKEKSDLPVQLLNKKSNQNHLSETAFQQNVSKTTTFTIFNFFICRFY